MNVEECSPLSNLTGTRTIKKLVVKMNNIKWSKMNTIKWSEGHEVSCKDEYGHSDLHFYYSSIINLVI